MERTRDNKSRPFGRLLYQHGGLTQHVAQLTLL
jgi:hypothetical protein